MHTKFTLQEGPKMHFEISVLAKNLLISELTKTSIKLNHFKIGKRNCLRSYSMAIIYRDI